MPVRRRAAMQALLQQLSRPTPTTCRAASRSLSRTTAWLHTSSSRINDGAAPELRLTSTLSSPRHLSTHRSVAFSAPCRSHARRIHTQALTGYAFAGKPRYDESSAEDKKNDEETATATTSLPRQGFPSDSQIGQWVDVMLRGNDAGEDSLAVTPMKGEGDWLLAVADGVGGWSENGVDPALFSQSLMFHAAQYAKQFHACPDRLEPEELAVDGAGGLKTPPPESSSSTSNKTQKGNAASKAEPGTPLDILEYAYRSTLRQKEVPAGSATACILTFDASKGVLRTANLGDSGFLILRPGSGSAAGPGGDKKTQQSEASTATANVTATDEDDSMHLGLHIVHHQSRPQTHGFNTPLQLSKLPPQYRFDGSIDSQPANADSYSCRLLDGDIVLVATDGFWDNVSTSEVLQLVAFVRQKHRTAWLDRMSDISSNDLAEERDLANVLAHNLLQYARMCQFSTTKTSPFERDAARHGIHYPGGKVDDIAILSALIVER